VSSSNEMSKISFCSLGALRCGAGNKEEFLFWDRSSRRDSNLACAMAQRSSGLGEPIAHRTRTPPPAALLHLANSHGRRSQFINLGKVKV
jgi:hypothetical protein